MCVKFQHSACHMAGAVISSNIKSKLYIHLTFRPPRPSPSHATSSLLQASLSKQVVPQGESPHLSGRGIYV